ncbi:anti-sigma factor [Parashewanella spongiae]|uniref:Anti-sigma-E factor RseA n=1 Tax=Parashewanella spongiae TaxID=342950 RepID=A0A3A6TDT8_9GAMM|nr:RseA family anti-sigma factor [Parashewanella spongiae]MCL1079246.1 anti-sigma factor [Parashewanella spongiae]RJY11066.1 anti-sigma factor [Parashewanella spongiae]
MDKLDQEWISAAVDGDVNNDRFDELVGDELSQAKWQRYHVIGDALRDELPETFSLDLSANIAVALESEPEIVAPVPPKQSQGTSGIKAKIVPLFKQFGQYAIAASVAVFAVIGVQNYQQQGSIENNSIPMINTVPLVGSASPVSLQTGPSTAKLSKQEYNEKILEQRRRVNAYLQDHMLQQRLNAGIQVQDISPQASASKNQR